MSQPDDASLPRRVIKPWGYEIWYALTDQYAGKILHVDRGRRLSRQYHTRRTRVATCSPAGLLLLRGPSVDELSQRIVTAGAVWRNRPADVHTREALEDSEVLEVSTADLDDIVRLEDDYGRTGTSQP